MKSHRKHFPHLGRGTMLGVAMLFTICFAVSPAFADTVPFPDIPTLQQYGYVSSGPNASLNINSGPIAGKILLGNGARLTGSGNNVCFTGAGSSVCNNTTGVPLQIDVSNATISSNPSNPTPAFRSVDPSVGVSAFNEAAILSSFAAGLPATQTFTTLPSGAANPIVGNGGLNVINVTGTGTSSGPINFQGTANDFFVINLNGSLSNNNPMVLNGVEPGNILWNFIGSQTGNRFSTSGGGAQFGTFLATNQAGNVNFQFSNLNLVGALWNTSGNIQNNSGSALQAFAPFSPPDEPEPPGPPEEEIPEPGTLSLLGTGMLGVGAMLRRKLRFA